MSEANNSVRSVGKSAAILAALALSISTAIAQTQAPLTAATGVSGPTGPTSVATASNTPPASPVADYQIGGGDVISVTILEAPEMGGKFRITDTGLLEMTGLSEPIHAEGQTAIELSRTIRQALVDAKILRDPTVNVFIEEYHGRTVTVLGAVAHPSVYPLERQTTVLEAIALAGGLIPTSGNTVTIIRGKASAEATNTVVGSVDILDMSALSKAENGEENIEVRKGDVISVSNGEVVYVVGAVAKPGGFVLPDPSSGMSVVQALAMAQGFTPVAATHRGLIIRQSTSPQGRTLVPIDIGQVLDGKEIDMRLAPNDILYVPESGTKKTLKVMGDVALAVINGVAIYGIGYRVGGVN